MGTVDAQVSTGLTDNQWIRLRTWLIWGGFAVVVLVGVAMCGDNTSGDNTPVPTTSSSQAPAVAPTSQPAAPTTSVVQTTAAPSKPSDAEIARAADVFVMEQLGLPPDGSPAMVECVDRILHPEYCWYQSINGFGWDFHAGVLQVTLQVDRESELGKAQGERAAIAVANFIKYGPGPPILTDNVDWVEVVDGTGTHIARQSL